ncbi:sugar ABC transporter permease [Kineothrix sedimenti]|uniref:Sugar ABC transporter permease n=1 Tax=Kineothrix sedimenti TaxID=3123317 RepID=A0ABZ3EWT3_9FIRM
MISYLFMAPALIILGIFVFYPIVFSIPLAFTNYSAVGGTTKFIGLYNFERLVRDPDFWLALKNSCLFVVVVPILQLLSILLALLMNQKFHGNAALRVLIYMPVVTSMVAVSIIWKFIFEDDGLINALLMNWNIIDKPISFLFESKIALIVLMGVTIWQGIGYYMMMYLSALQSFPTEILDASKIDGANAWQTFWKIRLPLLKNQIGFCSLISTIAAVGVFDVVFTMTNGGPNKSTYVINYYSYKMAFTNYDFGYSAAIGLVSAVIIGIFSCIQFAIKNRGGE